MKKYYIEYSREAKQDLVNIKKYIKYKLAEPNVAENLILKIKDCIDKLQINPQRHNMIDENIIKMFNIRKLIVNNYIVFYRITQNKVQIVRIMYGRRNWIKLL